jgi:hypothetical protein
MNRRYSNVVKLRGMRNAGAQPPPRDRATLAARLIASLDTLDESENENLWVQEAEQRYQAYKQGNISAKSTEEVFREARE